MHTVAITVGEISRYGARFPHFFRFNSLVVFDNLRSCHALPHALHNGAKPSCAARLPPLPAACRRAETQTCQRRARAGHVRFF